MSITKAKFFHNYYFQVNLRDKYITGMWLLQWVLSKIECKKRATIMKFKLQHNGLKNNQSRVGLSTHLDLKLHILSSIHFKQKEKGPLRLIEGNLGVCACKTEKIWSK